MVYPIVLEVLKVWSISVNWKVKIYVCKENEVNFSSDADVVAFSVYSQAMPSIYRLSKLFQQKGKIIIFGGPHFRGTYSKEDIKYCDILVHSICEEQWKKLLKEIKNGKIRPCSNTRIRFIIDSKNKFRYPDNFYEAFNSQNWWQIPSVPTSFGCPYSCIFCNPYMPGKYKVRDINTIYNELAILPKWKPVFIADATFGLNKQYTIKLMETISSLNMKILIESTLTRLKDIELLDSLSKGGVKWINIGVESFNSKLKKHGYGSVKDNINRFLDNAHKRGIIVLGNFICGLDSDGPEVFDEIYEFYKESSLDLIIIDILTPYPNTKLFDEMKNEGRIIDTNLEHYDYRHVVYRPKLMTKDQLIEGFKKLYKNLYSPQMIYKKLRNIFSIGGISTQTLGFVSFIIWVAYDEWRKSKSITI
jgi:radical SAM superfamily enzyme YgiQ (UPF0313 family)